LVHETDRGTCSPGRIWRCLPAGFHQTVIVGGELVNPRNHSAARKAGLRDPRRHGSQVGPGDIVTVPPATPYQVILEPGHDITYFAAKVVQ
jgi:hypothetical protein